jgi:cyanate permease
MVEAMSWRAALAMTSAFAALGALLWLWIRADRPLDEASAPPASR